jgi:hypothetical protein
MPFPQSFLSPAPATGGVTSTGVSVASNNVKYTDQTSATVSAGGSNRSIVFFRYIPKYHGEIKISVDASATVASTLRVFFGNATASSGISANGGGITLINALTPLGSSVAFNADTQNGGQGATESLGSIGASLTTLTTTFVILKKYPIYIGSFSVNSPSVTMQNLVISYDVIK